MTAAPALLRNEWLEVEVAPRGAELWSLRSVRTGIEYLGRGIRDGGTGGRPFSSPSWAIFRAAAIDSRGRNTGSPSTASRRTGNSNCPRPIRPPWKPICEGIPTPCERGHSASNSGSISTWTAPASAELHGEELRIGRDVFLHRLPPRFPLPLQEGERSEDYTVRFERPETLPRHELLAGLRTGRPIPFLQNSSEIPLRKELFEEGAIVLRSPSSRHVDLWNPRTGHGVRCGIEGFSWLGLWTGATVRFSVWNPGTGSPTGRARSPAWKPRKGSCACRPVGISAGSIQITPLLPE